MGRRQGATERRDTEQREQQGWVGCMGGVSSKEASKREKRLRVGTQALWSGGLGLGVRRYVLHQGMAGREGWRTDTEGQQRQAFCYECYTRAQREARQQCSTASKAGLRGLTKAAQEGGAS